MLWDCYVYCCSYCFVGFILRSVHFLVLVLVCSATHVLKAARLNTQRMDAEEEIEDLA